MKRLLILLIALLMLSTIATAQVTVSGYTEQNQKPAQGGQTSTTGTTQNYYVANKNIPAGTEISPGVKVDQEVKPGYRIATTNPISQDDINYLQLTEIPASTYNYAQSHNTYTYKNGQFTFTSSKKEDGTIEDYRTDTTTTINADGSKTVDQRYYVCGQGLLASCEDTGWDEQEGARQTVTTTTGTTKTSKGKDVTHQNSQTTTQYNDKGEPTGSTTTTYKYYEGTGTIGPKTVTVTDGANGKGNVIYTIDEGAEGKYTDESKLTDAQKANIDSANVNFVNGGGAGGAALFDGCQLLGTARCAGRFLRAFNEYSGLRQYSSIGLDDYDAQVRARKAEIQQEFCIAMGITQCLASKICEQRHELESGNVVAGRGPGGQFVTSASLNAENTPPIEIEGMTRQQLIDMFGNATVISGRLVNLTDPAFKPETLGRIKLRLYHVQYSVTNNLEEDALTYNLVFKRVPDQANSSYGKAAVEAKWFPGPKYPSIAKGDTAADDIYKFSATEYSDVCLTFHPGLPSGSPSGGIFGGDIDIVNQLCVPFSESTTATEGTAPPGSEETPTEAPTGQTPGALV